MKKIVTAILVWTIVFSGFMIFMPQIRAETDLSRPSLPDGPTHANQLANELAANTTNVLIVTEGWGPITGISPIQDKNLWVSILANMPGHFHVDWFDGIPTYTLLNSYDLVIYDAGGYWYPLSHVAGPLSAYHLSGKPLVVVAPDINYDWGMGHLNPDFVRNVLHIEGVLGILPDSAYDIYAGTGHSVETGLPNDIHVPTYTSYPDCFDPAPDAESALVQKYVVSTEFGVGTAEDLPSYAFYTPLNYYSVVAYPGSVSEGKVVTLGVPIAGLSESDSTQLGSNIISWALGELTGKHLLVQELNALNEQVDDSLHRQIELLAEMNARIYMEVQLSGLELVWDYVKKGIGVISLFWGPMGVQAVLDDLALNAPRLFDIVSGLHAAEVVLSTYNTAEAFVMATQDIIDGLSPDMGWSAVKTAFESGYSQSIPVGSSIGLMSYTAILDELHTTLVDEMISWPDEHESYDYMQSEVARIRGRIEETMEKETTISYVDLSNENLVSSRAIGGLSDFNEQLDEGFKAIDEARAVNELGFAVHLFGTLVKFGGTLVLAATAGTGAPITVAAEMAGKLIMLGGTALEFQSSVAESLTKEDLVQLVYFKAYPLIMENLDSYGDIYSSTLDLIQNWELKGDYTGEGTHIELDENPIYVDPIELSTLGIPLPAGLFAADVTGGAWLLSGQNTKGRVAVQVFAHDTDKMLAIVGNAMDLDAGVSTEIPFAVHIEDLMLDDFNANLYRIVAYVSIGTQILGAPLVQQFVVAREGTISAITTGSYSSSVVMGEVFTETISTETDTEGLYLSLDYPGSDLDLHLFDSQGNHIGMDYSTGSIEVQIPNARYSGPDKNPEWISIEGDIEEETFQATVVGISVKGQEPFVLSYAVSTEQDTIPPSTTIEIGSPKYVYEEDTFITSATPISLSASDNPEGEGLASTHYRIQGGGFDSGWLTYSVPFYLSGLADGFYYVDYYSIDVAGNTESTNTKIVYLDNSPPQLTIETPSEGAAVQDGITLTVSAYDVSAVDSVEFSILCPEGNIISPAFESMPAIHSSEDTWTLYFDTTQLPDGYYLLSVEGTDALGNTGTTARGFSIRNWACVELLPASERNNPGRTMPVKFSLRIVEAVDPFQPFVWNEELTIIISNKDSSEILQTSLFGSGSRNYRIDCAGELYITNFKTLKKPATYLVEVFRKGFLIGFFEFSTEGKG